MGWAGDSETKYRRGCAKPGKVGEQLFHRIDARQDPSGTRRFYLSTRHHAAVRENAAARAAKLQRTRAYRLRFEQAVRATGASLSFSTTAADHSSP